MQRPLFLAAMRLEARFVRAGAADNDLELIGVGAAHASAAVSRLLPSLMKQRPVVLLGVSGALIPGYSIGELVVGSSVASDEHPRTVLPHADEAAALLSRHGISTRVVPLASSRGLVRGQQRAAMASLGEVVDMESASCVELVAHFPFVVVRSIVDSPEHELVSPGIFANATPALRSLKWAARALSGWAPTTVVPNPSLEAADS